MPYMRRAARFRLFALRTAYHQVFKFGEKLGSGTFATVVLVTENATKKKFAMKVIEKAKSKGMEEQIIKEITILKRIQHPNIVRLYECYETRDKIYMQMEYVDGGELFDRIVNLGFYGEEDARSIVKNILEAVKYLHESGVVHRDLKPENLLMASKDEHAEVKLADFGLSTLVDNDSMLKTSCGTLTYCVCTEILRGEKYGKPVDLWSIGVISYILLSGYPPFWDKDEASMMELTLRGKFTFFSPDWDEISDTAKDFITKTIQVDANTRLTAQQAVQHKWITKDSTGDQKINMIERVGDNLVKHFNARRKLKVGVDAVKFINTIRHLGAMHIALKGKDAPGGSPADQPIIPGQQPTVASDMGSIMEVNSEIVRSTATSL
ncbi:kinase-like domain-containing protein [Entophlyctis helioformis]|nr:kinase-like domain-containing protein [Entophlyctis helioformis]